MTGNAEKYLKDLLLPKMCSKTMDAALTPDYPNI